jgi:hypothetical protein
MTPSTVWSWLLTACWAWADETPPLSAPYATAEKKTARTAIAHLLVIASTFWSAVLPFGWVLTS